ncbi:centrosomal protein of 83 kDa-like [Dreissena polymorpha]|uniref:centrosomal protein of 83 kDa-like n=1 Tax=Dreissena polymorpha TaxID=45954 RepID=UPI002264E352|nr:centrosomal protein of 83 kDa-like [Dreissena polymorpha]
MYHVFAVKALDKAETIKTDLEEKLENLHEINANLTQNKIELSKTILQMDADQQSLKKERSRILEDLTRVEQEKKCIEAEKSGLQHNLDRSQATIKRLEEEATTEKANSDDQLNALLQRANAFREVDVGDRFRLKCLKRIKYGRMCLRRLERRQWPIAERTRVWKHRLYGLRQDVRLLGDGEPMAFALFSGKDSNIPVSNEIRRWITDKELWTFRDVFLLEHKCMTTETVNMLFQFFAFGTSEEAQATMLKTENDKLRAAKSELQRQHDSLTDEKDEILKDKKRQIKDTERCQQIISRQKQNISALTDELESTKESLNTLMVEMEVLEQRKENEEALDNAQMMTNELEEKLKKMHEHNKELAKKKNDLTKIIEKIEAERDAVCEANHILEKKSSRILEDLTRVEQQKIDLEAEKSVSSN